MIRSIRSTLLFALALTLASSAAARAQAAATQQGRDSEKITLLKRMLTQTRAVEIAMNSMEQGVQAQRIANPRIPAVFWDRFIAKARASKADLESLIINIYDKKFTTDDIRQLVAFYDTPLGKKLLSTLPSITQESMTAGQQWGARIGAEVGNQLAAEGVRIEP